MTIQPTGEQQAIIDHPLLPLRVTAGAGTGKTTTMAMRLAGKILDGSVAADRTLGITFTNKAAEELADSIRRRVGEVIEPGHEVEVTTYHGFAFGIVREFGPLVGLPRSVRVVTPGYVRQLLRDALGLESRHHLDLTKAGTVVDELRRLASALGDHLRRAADLFGSGDPDLAPVRDEMATVLESFEHRKQQLALVDYSDLVGAAHRILASHPDIAQRIRDRYDLVLLDEYQDTNPGQRELLLALFADGFPVTAVGDSDQTIYEWRGASPQNFEDFPTHFPNPGGDSADSLTLSTSWRSGTLIVDVANEVRRQISTPGPLGSLVARHDAPPARVRSHWLHSAVAEAEWIAGEVVRLHEEEGVAWRDMALLFRKHRQMATIRDALAGADVPVEVASLGGLLDVPEVVDIHAWLRILGRPDDAPALARILLGSRYRLGLGDLAPLTRWVQTKRGAGDEASIGWALLEAVDHLESVADLADEKRERLERFRDEYRELLEIAQGVSLVELCRRILDRTDAWPDMDALPASSRLSARLNVYRLLDLAEDWSPLEGRPSLEAFLDHLDLLAHEGAAEELDTARVSGEDAVALLTVHRAKGLEWPVVVLPALAEGTFPSRVVRYEDPRSVPSVLPHELRLDHDRLPDLPADRDERRAVLRVVHDDAEWRTAYVGVTRAARELIATGAWWYTDGRPKRRSRLFEIIDALAEAEPGRSEEAGDPPTTLRIAVGAQPGGPDPHFEAGATAFLRAVIDDAGVPAAVAAGRGIAEQYDAAVEQLKMELGGLPQPLDPSPEDHRFHTSVTGLVTFAGCPLRFKWEHIERLPRRPSPAARHGLELHRRIEAHHRGRIAFDAEVPDFHDADDVTDGRGGADLPTAFERFAGSRFAQERPILVETPFELLIGEAVLAGRIDAVYQPDPSRWEIVDFKSGAPSADPARRVQLEAYAVAADEAMLDGRAAPDAVSVTFAHFGGPAMEVVSEEVDDQWLEGARRHLAELMAGAAEGPYGPVPGDRCRSCDFVRFCDAGTTWLEGRS